MMKPGFVNHISICVKYALNPRPQAFHEFNVFERYEGFPFVLACNICVARGVKAASLLYTRQRNTPTAILQKEQNKTGEDSMSQLAKLTQITDLRQIWKHEVRDFSRWLSQEDNLRGLSDVLGMAIVLKGRK